MVYKPREDSYFLSEILTSYLDGKKVEELKVLDIGTGSGIQVETLLEEGVKRENILASDIDSEALDNVKKEKVETVNSDLFSNINEKFDLIIFNPPYLPGNYSNKEIGGGERGDEVIVRFLKKVKRYLKPGGEALLLLSSLTPRYRIDKVLGREGLDRKKIGEKYLFFEGLVIWKIT